ncbi:MAG: GGDEF domain-containing protein, partial [Lachnospiraceae bacterium]|nr:GGDEF domain-containing protein [Lachnospiraceae bacterium]
MFNVRNLTWELAVSPANGCIPVWSIFVSILIIVIISGFVGVFASIMFRLHESNAMLLRLSTTDGLTGCLNRRAYEEALLTLPDKMSDENFVYVTADVNSLKNTNDTLGHLSGDELICGAAACLQDCFGDNGDIYRIGGDEFAALVYADENIFDKLIEKIYTLTDNWKGDSVENLTLSIGYASAREFPDAEINTLIKTADERMYKAKREYYQNKGVDRRQGK